MCDGILTLMGSNKRYLNVDIPECFLSLNALYMSSVKSPIFGAVVLFDGVRVN